jgi:hypothetical protein
MLSTKVNSLYKLKLKISPFATVFILRNFQFPFSSPLLLHIPTMELDSSLSQAVAAHVHQLWSSAAADAQRLKELREARAQRETTTTTTPLEPTGKSPSPRVTTAATTTTESSGSRVEARLKDLRQAKEAAEKEKDLLPVSASLLSTTPASLDFALRRRIDEAHRRLRSERRRKAALSPPPDALRGGDRLGSTSLSASSLYSSPARPQSSTQQGEVKCVDPVVEALAREEATLAEARQRLAEAQRLREETRHRRLPSPPLLRAATAATLLRGQSRDVFAGDADVADGGARRAPTALPSRKDARSSAVTPGDYYAGASRAWTPGGSLRYTGRSEAVMGSDAAWMHSESFGGGGEHSGLTGRVRARSASQRVSWATSPYQQQFVEPTAVSHTPDIWILDTSIPSAAGTDASPPLHRSRGSRERERRSPSPMSASAVTPFVTAPVAPAGTGPVVDAGEDDDSSHSQSEIATPESINDSRASSRGEQEHDRADVEAPPQIMAPMVSGHGGQAPPTAFSAPVQPVASSPPPHEPTDKIGRAEREQEPQIAPVRVTQARGGVQRVADSAQGSPAQAKQPHVPRPPPAAAQASPATIRSKRLRFFRQSHATAEQEAAPLDSSRLAQDSADQGAQDGHSLVETAHATLDDMPTSLPLSPRDTIDSVQLPTEQRHVVPASQQHANQQSPASGQAARPASAVSSAADPYEEGSDTEMQAHESPINVSRTRPESESRSRPGPAPSASGRTAGEFQKELSWIQP